MPTLTVRYEYVVSRAQWKLLTLTWENGVATQLPRQRYFDQQKEMVAVVQDLYRPTAVHLARRDICREEQHSVRQAEYLAQSQDRATVYLRCTCRHLRAVPRAEWEASQQPQAS
jgi:hypothetical protein